MSGLVRVCRKRTYSSYQRYGMPNADMRARAGWLASWQAPQCCNFCPGTVRGRVRCAAKFDLLSGRADWRAGQ